MKRFITILILGLLNAVAVQGQIKIGGNVYGGGNKGKVNGNTRVTVKAGDIGATDKPDEERPLDNPLGRVFGGARMADVGGNAFVNIDGEHATGYILINYVYGGNDIAGHIGTKPENKKMPLELEEVIPEPTADVLTTSGKTRDEWRAAYKTANPKKNDIDKTWDSYVRISTGTEKTYIGQLFGGGNGEFEYTDSEGNPLQDGDGNYLVKQGNAIIAKSKTQFNKPELGKAYLEVEGGSIVYAYGGGNNATVTDKTVIYVDNPSDVVNHIYVKNDGTEDKTATEASHDNATDLLSTKRFLEMGINTTFSKPSSDEFQIGRFFGGNNKAEMNIRPTWNLQGGKIRNLYSGGNKGDMTYSEGLLLEINPVSGNTNPLIIDYVYGGCRMANVRPMLNGQITTVANLPGYFFPTGLSARTLVRGGDINNVFGGNDVTGRVYGGNAVGIYTSIRGDVYGGGNGAYPYTDNWNLGNSTTYGDLYYGDRGDTESSFANAFKSLEALNNYRPNAEQVSIRITGTEANPTIIGGSVYCGGNCATLVPAKEKPMVELKIGSYAIADKVFLGNNGEGMIDKDILKHYKYRVDANGNVVTSGGTDFSTIDLTSIDTDADGKKPFDIYMDGAAMSLMPSVVFDQEKANGTGDPATYIGYTSQVGSFYCGGNVGSMTYPKKIDISFDRELIIYNKVVGGCNNANVSEQYLDKNDSSTKLNTEYFGGLLGAVDATTGDKLQLTFNGLKIEPKRLYKAVASGTSLVKDDIYYTYDNIMRVYTPFKAKGTETGDGYTYYTLGTELEWNTAKWDDEKNDFVQIGVGDADHKTDDNARRLLRGNIYGGCFHSGHVEGNVVINIEADLMEKDKLFAESTEAADGTYSITGDRRTGVILAEQSEDLQSVAMSVFGAGYGEDSEIWGSTTVNLKKNAYVFQIFGGGEKGVVGKSAATGEYALTHEHHEHEEVSEKTRYYNYDSKYSTTVNLAGSTQGSETAQTATTQYIYGGGNEGLVCGDVTVNLGNGRVDDDVFGGSCNADILGHTEVYIGGYGDWKTVGTGESATKTLEIKAKGFPWIGENVYTGNDFGGSIKGKGNYKSLLSEERMSMVYDGDKSSADEKTAFREDLLNSNAFATFIQGRVENLYGGNYGSYDYTDEKYSVLFNDNFTYPHFDNSFIYFQPANIQDNEIQTIFGGSQGKEGIRTNNYTMQERSYVLIDDINTDYPDRYSATDVYGGGAFAGLGSKENIGGGRSAIDLLSGRINNVYGGCNREGLIGYSRVNVPSGSTIQVNALYGGGKGYEYVDETNHEEGADPSAYCDTYATCINYQSADAAVENGIYGGNRNMRVACDTYINIGTAVKNREGLLGTVYGAGYGDRTVSGRTNIFLNDGAQVKEVYGGGRDGNTFNFPSLTKWLAAKFVEAGETDENKITEKVYAYGKILRDFKAYIDNNHPINLPSDIGIYDNKVIPATNTYPDYHNTNVHIMAGAEVKGNPKATGGTDGGYAYAGGLGVDAVVGGTTYIELKGGTVEKDIYAGGTSGPVYDEFKLGTFTAGTYANIESGTCRNVYGGGWRGDVGYAKYIDGSNVLFVEKDDNGNILKTHYEQIPDFNDTNDQFKYLGESHVTIGRLDGTDYTDGIPAIRRNVYGGGEGGAIYGTAHITINKGYIGYHAVNTSTSDVPKYEFEEELDDYLEGDNKMKKHGGNVFGGGYVANSYVDNTNVQMFGGTIRGGLFGGGEIGPIGRGTVKANPPEPNSGSYFDNHEARIYKAGKTHVEMYGGQVMRNIFGGGRGYDNWETYGWMSDVEKQTMDLSSKGYVFGNTEVFIHGGKVGTKDATSFEDGNVFGGGDEGFVYSATGTKNTATDGDGYYYGNDNKLTEDCKVIISPYCYVNDNYIDASENPDDPDDTGTEHEAGSYVTTEYLNTLANGSTQWDFLDQTGIDITNAVFAGGNISAGSDKISVNTTTVFGNATASVTDVFAKDLITIGEDGVGGLYGDGNLTFVDGYRELNISNYGTDYYNLSQTLSLEEYKKLSDRERAYFELLYKPKQERTLEYYESRGTHVYHKGEHTDVSYKRGQKLPKESEEYASLSEEEKTNWSGPHKKTYGVNDKITQDDYNLLWAEEQPYWDLYGFCTLYAGRMINTIQRADFCGVFGSRVVMRGAQDRVPKTVDYTEYTINRVGEVSLNKQYNPNYENTDANFNEHGHGNYFGIYNVVNYLGALTSDVYFYDIRKTNNTDYQSDFVLDNTTYHYGDEGATYENWKKANLGNRKRNNGTSPNEVALASGVWLELLDESTESQPNKEKVYGPITGIVELTLINVAPGEGGGYVYAKNLHGVRSETHQSQVTLAAANHDARSYKMYSYDTSDINCKMQTSGNFVNSTKRIIDDCYPQNGAYYNREGGEKEAPAHYWFIRGDYYVYDQYISAYTGSSQAYAENVSIPLTITAESQGRLQLTQVQPNLYAYWENIDQIEETYRSQSDRDAILVGGITYKLNEPISYWAWSHLSDTEKHFFTEETWVCSNDAEYNNKEYKKGDVYATLPADIYICKENITGKDIHDQDITYPEGTVLTKSLYDALTVEAKNDCAAVFNVSNAVNHENGFLLTFDWDNPDVWNDYYHQKVGQNTYRASITTFDDTQHVTSPSFQFNTSGSTVLGQLNYIVGDIIDATTYQYEIEKIAAPVNGEMVSKQDLQGNDLVNASTQAQFDSVYIAVTNHNFTAGGVDYVPNACISATTYNTLSDADKANFDAGKLCTTTYEHLVGGESSYIIAGTVIPESTYNSLGSDKDKFFSDGYICKEAGLWGGTVFNGGQHYPAISYSNLSKGERGNFVYNYDALDLLVDPNYENDMSKYDKPNADPIYSKKQSIDYEATYTGASDLQIDNVITVKYYDSASSSFKTRTTTDKKIHNGEILTNEQYENLVNEAVNYTPIVVDPKHKPDTTYYVVKTGFQIGDKWYSEGNQMTYEVYDGLSSTDKAKVDPITFKSLTGLETNVSVIQRYYYCTNSYPAITAVTDINGGSHATNSTVTVGTIIPETGNNLDGYANLVNQQRYFSINGKTPTETSTLYVARDVDINNLSQDRIVTVVYHYDYLESDDTGNSYEKIREYHVVNVHVHFESGMPTIGELLPPNTVLPGNVVNLNQPSVTKGAYELLGGGWEIFKSPEDAETHKNGTPFTSSATPLYWYQDGYQVAYYALSYLGKTYSNAVPLSVANYHRMNEVLDINGDNVTTENNYMYLNEAVKVGKRDPKVYIKNENELKKFAKFFDETHTKSELSNIEDCKNIDFIIDGDIVHTGTWTPIANNNGCFQGTIHGDGHTISGLTPADGTTGSLIGHLCKDVYNLGVTGSFTGGGIADTGDGYVESCWINTTGTPDANVQAVFGTPSASSGTVQIVNCYYPNTLNYKATGTDSHGVATAKSQQAFYNGEVAYDLNNFYLYKRYSDKNATSGNVVDYKYKTKTATGVSEPIMGHYDSSPANCSSGYNNAKYVENRYIDGDFRYAGGTIPTVDDDRRVIVNELTGEAEYYPIWPDDYIFFGQKLNYGYSTSQSHQSLPSAIVKDGGLLPNPNESELSNRVYRAPAYYRSMNMGVVHFNPWAYLVAKSSDGKDAYPYMTAVDFAGHNDTHDESTKAAKPYELGLTTAGKFYPPLLDDDGLSEIFSNETKNLLVYAPAESAESGYANASTYAALSKYFKDPSYNSFNESSDNYNDGHDYGRVASAEDAIKSIHGHLVQSDLTADTDHLLVDKQDFNAPFEYTFDSSNRMWYQRLPENYVETDWSDDDIPVRSTKGWEGVSLPFTAEIVTTDQKGELTHFYTGSTIGHEYWLREFGAVEDGTVENTVKANMSKLAANGTSKSVSNKFLWDYYYQGLHHGHKDQNDDTYQTYYNEDIRTYSDYPRQAAATPYIIGFPSKQYYEFDLSGNFVAQNTKVNIDKLDKQIISFVSQPGITIGVSDKEMDGVTFKLNSKDYTFKPNYMAKDLDAGVFVLNVDGNSYDKTDAKTTPVPFRPYFTEKTSASGSRVTRSIIFSNDENSEIPHEEYSDGDIDDNGKIIVKTSRRKIEVKSTLKETVNVRILTMNGITINTFALEPGQTVETRLSNAGVYIVQSADGKLLKKLTVR